MKRSRRGDEKKKKMKTLFPLDDFIEDGSIKLRAPLHFDWFAPSNNNRMACVVFTGNAPKIWTEMKCKRILIRNDIFAFVNIFRFSFFYTISFEIRMLIIVYNVGMSNGGTRLVKRGVNSNLLKYTQTKNLVYKKRCVIQYELDLIEQLWKWELHRQRTSLSRSSSTSQRRIQYFWYIVITKLSPSELHEKKRKTIQIIYACKRSFVPNSSIDVFDLGVI